MKATHEKAHAEVVAALRAIGNPERGEAIRLDRGSALQHLGIAFPALRARVKQDFSFTALPEVQVLEVWDALWHHSPYGDVLFAALEFYAPLVRKPMRMKAPAGLWPVVQHWAERVDNWCHADALAGLYSRLLQADPPAVLPQLQAWNASQSPWLRRLSITSLIHYSGKNAVFLPLAQMLPLLAACVPERRKPVEMALGWVLRELARVHPESAAAFLAQHAPNMSARALARARE